MPIFLSQALNEPKFVARNFMFVPTQDPRGDPTRSFLGLIILSGVVMVDVAGNDPGGWRHDQVILDLGVDLKKAIGLAPYAPPVSNRFYGFYISQLVPFATVNARESSIREEHDGTAVDAFFGSQGGALITIDVGVRDHRSMIHRIGYHLSLYGSLLFKPSFEGTTQGEGALAHEPTSA
jgi:hypothetical protein